MKKFGLIGYPIAHSLSPAAFKAAYGGKYPYDLIECRDWASGFQKFLDGYDAVQVTMPFKEQAFAAADVKSPECERIGAANILVKTADGVVAHNSDYLGVKALLEDNMVGRNAQEASNADESACLSPRALVVGCGGESSDGSRPRALVVGCGGAGKAAAIAAADCGFEVLVTNRTIARAEEFVRRVAAVSDDASVAGNAVPEILPFDAPFDGELLIYCLPCAVDGMGRWQCNKVLEANYKDPVLSEVSGYISGLSWHHAQAVEGFRIMTGEEVLSTWR